MRSLELYVVCDRLVSVGGQPYSMLVIVGC
jgi:hypothetical protein